jgi:DNA-binding transcriptional LysR family regulator
MFVQTLLEQPSIEAFNHYVVVGLPGLLKSSSTPRSQAHLSGGTLQEVEIVPGVVVPEPAVVKTMLILGAGIGQLPDFHAMDAIANGTLVRALPDHEGDTVDAHALYTNHRSLSAKARVFIDALAAG